jgi:L-serine deaminase
MSMGPLTGVLPGFLHFQDGAALVRSALGAGAVGQLLFVAVGTLGEARRGQKIVGAAVGGAARGVAPFRIRHREFLS